MTVTLLGHRASSPKPSHNSRNLRKLQHNFNDAHIPRSGRMLPVPPCKPPEAHTGARQTRALPRVPRPMGTSVNSISVNILSSTDTVVPHGRDINPAAVPTLPHRHPRQLPKLPAAGGKTQDRKHYMLEMYRVEGDKFMGEAEYEKAMDSYSSALKLVPDNTETFVARSRCNQLLGRNRKAMLDVDSALALDPNCPEALYQKAELLFSERNYESALVYYDKGYRQRPDLRKFHEGAEKATEAINGFSGRRRRKAQAGDLSMAANNSKNRKDPIRRRNNLAKLSPIANSVERDVPTPTPSYKQQNPLVRTEQGRGQSDRPTPTPTKVTDDQDVTEKRIKEVLGKMYSDKKYLEKLMEQADVPRGSVDLTNMAETGLNFLYDRVLYWVRQGRIIPPEAPGTRPSTFKSQSNASTVKAKIVKIHKESKETKEKDPMPPGSWFRYLDKKKAAEANSRKANPPQFIHVLEGQKVPLRDTVDPLRSQRPVIRRPKQDNTLKLKRRRNNTLKDNLSQHHTSSDSDSGLNISFSTYKGHSDLDLKSNGSARRISQDVTEELTTPTNTLKPPNTDMSKYSRGQRRRVRQEPIISYINKVIEDIEFAYVEGKYSECARKAKSCLNTMNSYKMDDIPNVMSLTAKLYSYIGNAAIEMRDYVTGLEYHQRDLDIGERSNDTEAISRALGNLGRIYVFQSKHQKALDVFSRKIQLCTTRVESAWLYHEIGNCFLVLGQYEYAREAARRSVEAAEEALDWNYQLQSLVLLGVVEVKLRQYHAAFNTFERAMDQARMQGDNKAETAIRDALNDVNDKIVEELKSRSRSQADFTRSRADYAKSRAEWSDYSSIYIPEDDGDVSLTETGYDTENLQLELDRLRSDLDTAMFGSQFQEGGRKSGGHVSSELRKSLQNLQMSGRNSVTNSVIRCSTALA